MLSGTALCFMKPVLVVAGIAAVGMGGYNFATTGCPLGRCEAGTTAGVATPAGHTSTKDGCPMGGCSSEGSSEAVLLTSTTPNEAGHGACAGMDASLCSDAMKAACETTGECPMGAGVCEGMDPAECQELCETECPHAVPAGQVAEGAAPGQGDTGAGEG